MPNATRESILADPIGPLDSLDIEPWGTLYIRQLTLRDIETIAKDADKDDRNARMCCRVLCDESGKRFFNPDDPADVELVAGLGMARMKLVMDKANTVNGKGPGAEETLKKDSTLTDASSST